IDPVRFESGFRQPRHYLPHATSDIERFSFGTIRFECVCVFGVEVCVPVGQEFGVLFVVPIVTLLMAHSTPPAAIRANATLSLNRLLSALMRAVRVLPIAKRNGAATSGASCTIFSKGPAPMRNKTESSFAITSAERGP